ncbi:PrsW family intramembrane metalloprotease [Austwickia chelonae]|uniref:PrsW family intramembrane metalloprotease n=1 Tax=Austwickia chelonae TaxID=100225 RepID=UPI0013C2FB67|nr:PrsW family intramembrane metalloprotease [Austwickia chelonae]
MSLISGTMLTMLFFFVPSVTFCVWAMMQCDAYQVRRTWVMLASYASGATIAVYLSLMGNSYIRTVVPSLLGEELARMWSAAIFGPSTEEWSKAVCVALIMLIAKETLTRPVHGLMVGGFVGLGFQVTEDLVYTIQTAVSHTQDDLRGASFVAAVRYIGNFTSHNLFSAIAGIGVAYLLGRTGNIPVSGYQRIKIFAGFYGLAWCLHFVVNAHYPEQFFPVMIIAKVPIGLTILYFVLQWLWRSEQSYLKEAAVAVSGADPGDLSQLTELEKIAIGSPQERRRYLRRLRKSEGAQAARRTKRQINLYLIRLQAWGRYGTGVDEHLGNQYVVMRAAQG